MHDPQPVDGHPAHATETLKVTPKLKRIQGFHVPLLSTEISFSTSYARRALRNCFYFVSVMLFHLKGKADDASIVAAQNLFFAQMDALQSSFAPWPVAENTLAQYHFSEVLLTCPHCAKLLAMFSKMDQVLKAPSQAKASGLIDQTQIDAIVQAANNHLKAFIAEISTMEDDKAVSPSAP